MKLEEAIKVLQEELTKDKNYRESWKANIAMAFVDCERWYREDKQKQSKYLNREDLSLIANSAADYFLNQLTQKT